MKVDGEDDEDEHSCQWHRMRQIGDGDGVAEEVATTTASAIRQERLVIRYSTPLALATS